MNIAQIGPFYEAVSLHSEGPEGRMIASLSEGLLRLRHDVTVFASGDSHTVGRVIQVAPLAMRAYPMPKRHLADALAMLALEKAFAMAPTFDMIHVHAGSVAFPLMRRSPIPIVGIFTARSMPRKYCDSIGNSVNWRWSPPRLRKCSGLLISTGKRSFRRTCHEGRWAMKV